MLQSERKMMMDFMVVYVKNEKSCMVEILYEKYLQDLDTS